MMEQFEYNEYVILAMFQAKSRSQTMDAIRGVMPYVGEDEEILTLVNSTLEKLEHISDAEFLQMDLEMYKDEPAENEEWN
jgi:hypothetical protein